jgi:hypothetical protein
LGYSHHKEGCSIQEGYAHGHGELVHYTTSETPYGMHTHEVAVTNLR